MHRENLAVGCGTVYPVRMMETVKLKPPVIFMPVCPHCQMLAPKCECGKPTKRPA